MAMSLDGKIATKARGPVKLGSAYDSRRMAELRAEHDVIINGAATFRAHPFALNVIEKDLVSLRIGKGLSDEPASAIVSSRLDIPWSTPWEKATGTERWAFCGKRAPKKAIERLQRAGVVVVQSKAERPMPKEILSAFKRVGKNRVLLEGGGEFNASFLEKGLVDTIYLTLTPLIIGGAESPSWCEGKGFSKGRFPRFHLADCRQVAGELYLTYSRA